MNRRSIRKLRPFVLGSQGTSAAGLGDKAYRAAVREAIEAVTGRKCSIGALYTTIERLEAKGLLRTRMGEATSQRGGRSKRMVRVTAAGVSGASTGCVQAAAAIGERAAESFQKYCRSLE